MQPTLRLRHVHKRFVSVHAVNDVSLDVFPGEIFGLLGPNGAGKTTTIRMIMGIIFPDEGEIQVLGHKPVEVKERVGYLPEERGLYPNMRVLDFLVYLAELKGRPKRWARQRARHLLEKVGLIDRANMKIRALSRGLQQKVQFLSAIVHDPDLCVFDEPFQGLDPVNLQVIKEFIRELRAEGKTIILSTHQMNQVEALCNRIALINHGRLVLYGDLNEIKQKYSPNIVLVRSETPLPAIPGVIRQESRDGMYFLELAEDATPQAVLRELLDAGVNITYFEQGRLPLEDIFVRVVKEREHELA